MFEAQIEKDALLAPAWADADGFGSANGNGNIARLREAKEDKINLVLDSARQCREELPPM